MEIKAIETRYNGYRFRSRLEARWAIFFDRLLIPYNYEMEGFTRNGINYLPDFYLPEGIRFLGMKEGYTNVWAEVKHSLVLTQDEREKAAQFVRGTGNKLLLLGGDPGPKATMRFISFKDEAAEWDAPLVSWIDLGATSKPCLLRHDMLPEIQDLGTRQWAFKQTLTPRLMAAYTAAREAHFERSDRIPHQDDNHKQCQLCGKSFVPLQSYHRLCPTCYRQKRNEDEIEIQPSAKWSMSVPSSRSQQRAYQKLDKKRGCSPGCILAIIIAMIILGWLIF